MKQKKTLYQFGGNFLPIEAKSAPSEQSQV